MGVCLGVMVSEKLYLASQEAALEPGAVEAARSRKLEVGGGGGAAAALPARRSSGKPRNALEEILQRVAPQGEVMIAISNYNLVLEQSLVMWLEVRWYQTAANDTVFAAWGAGQTWRALLVLLSGALFASGAASAWRALRLRLLPCCRVHVGATARRCLPQCVQRIPSLTNYLVVAIDEQLRDYCVQVGAGQLRLSAAAHRAAVLGAVTCSKLAVQLPSVCGCSPTTLLCRALRPLPQHNINHYYRPVVIPDSQKDTGSNHAISAMKCAGAGAGGRGPHRWLCICAVGAVGAGLQRCNGLQASSRGWSGRGAWEASSVGVEDRAVPADWRRTHPLLHPAGMRSSASSCSWATTCY